MLGCNSPTVKSDECRSLNPQSDRNPGDPELGVKGLKRLYEVITVYKKQNGTYPNHQKLVDFSREIIPGTKLKPEDLSTADAKFSPRYVPGALLGGNPFAIWCDEKTDTKATVPLLSTDLYVRDGAESCGSKGNRYTYSGVYLVLWIDGRVEKIKPGDMMCYPTADGLTVNAIPGDPKVPATAIKMRDHYAKNESKLVFPPKYL